MISRQHGATWAQVGVWIAPRSGRVRFEHVRVFGYSSPLAAWIRSLELRALTGTRYLRRGVTGPSISYRERELQAVGREWRRSSLLRNLIGQGLGRTFQFQNRGWGPGGRRVVLQSASYIHNFYVFLVFKLGAMGLVALLGLLMIVGWTARRAWEARGARGEAWIFAATFAAWSTYLLWSFTSPEIYDFRVAPIWGLLIAVCAHEHFRSGAARGTAVDEAGA